MEYIHLKEQNIAYRETLQDDDHLAKVTLEKIVAEKSRIVEKSDQMMQMEESNYELTIVNQSKSATVEKMIEVVPEMVGAIQSLLSGKSTGVLRLQRTVQQIEDDEVKWNTKSVLTKYKLIQ